MKVREMMTSDVKTCRPETNLAEAVRDMWEGDCGALPVVNDEGRVTGVITIGTSVSPSRPEAGPPIALRSARWPRATRTPVCRTMMRRSRCKR